MSEKELGNTKFKEGQYKEAIQHYQNYVASDHDDNKNAWFNMSLCFSKQKRAVKSVEAAEMAVQIDPNYFKCYYRLANQYQKIKDKDYQVFINAVRFMRISGQEQHKERREQMQEIVNSYKKKLAIEKNSNLEKKNIQAIAALSESLVEEREIREEVDKEIWQWNAEWSQGTQDDQAKWLQIEYITEDIDYDFGISLAYYYLNQLKSKDLKKCVQNQITELQQRLGKEKNLDFSELGIDSTQQPPKETPDDEEDNLFDDDDEPFKEYLQKEEERKKQKNIQNLKRQEQEEKQQKEEERPKKTIQEKLEEKRKKLQGMDGEETQPQKIRHEKEKKGKEINQDKQKQSAKEKKETSSQPVRKEQEKQKDKEKDKEKEKEKEKKKEASQKEVKKQVDIEEHYDKFCGELTSASSKVIFKAAYECVLKILESKKLKSETKGELFILLKKRVKKFKLIMQAKSEKEQFILFDLLKKESMEEYAIDLAPKYHKL